MFFQKEKKKKKSSKGKNDIDNRAAVVKYKMFNQCFKNMPYI